MNAQREAANQFYGERSGSARDPFGHRLRSQLRGGACRWDAAALRRDGVTIRAARFTLFKNQVRRRRSQQSFATASSQPLVLDPVGTVGIFAGRFEALAVIGLVLLIVALEEHHLAFTFVGEDVGGDPI